MTIRPRFVKHFGGFGVGYHDTIKVLTLHESEKTLDLHDRQELSPGAVQSIASVWPSTHARKLGGQYSTGSTSTAGSS
ncbi:hypothetical protein C7451_105165 [Blastomonas natatoria]|uniref:Uncharacterized protein n=1 Tax=Blastomonas natatoria TaxID=34015 RepID=A0A2V3V3M8_9SPHN|nr:hypothetical protein C7451_105165 [Blastomonas natatoria]